MTYTIFIIALYSLLIRGYVNEKIFLVVVGNRFGWLRNARFIDTATRSTQSGRAG